MIVADVQYIRKKGSETMAIKNIIHWNMDALDNVGASINLAYGERSNGKSYQVKHKKAVVKYIESGKRFILIRRWKDEVTTEKIERYFADVDVEKLTDGRYNCISMYRKVLYLANYDIETAKTKRGEKIGYVIALSQEQNYAGASYLDVEDIIFEEFMSRGLYIANEPDKLMNLYCTVDRKRGTTRLWLVGNSISRVCPYLVEWKLLARITKQEQGTIFTEDIQADEDTSVKIAVEYCESTGASSYVIGKHADMLNKGEWQSDPQPHLPKSNKEYILLYRIVFKFKSFMFLAEYLADKDTNNCVWFIYPKKTQIKPYTVVITDDVQPDIFYQRDIYLPSGLNDRVVKILQTFKENCIFYATDLCGTDFKQVIDFTIRK